MTTTRYHSMIIEDTGCTSEQAHKVEEYMREEVFHSTLDWQTRLQFRNGAKRAHTLARLNGEL